MLEVLVEDMIRILTIPPVRFSKPSVISFVAPPGSGKTYLSEILAQRLNFTVLSGEKLQTFLNPSPTYFSLKLENIMELAIRVIENLVKQNISTVFDASINKRADRLLLGQRVRNAGGQFILIRVVAGDEIVIERLNRKNIEIVGGTRYGVVLTREYYLAEKSKIEELFGEAYLNYDSSLGDTETERIVGEIRSRLGPVNASPVLP